MQYPSRYIATVANILKRSVFYLIRCYQKFISPALPPSCRYYPTCSNYALQSIEKYGIIKGGAKTLLRILKCNPLFPGGYDPV